MKQNIFETKLMENLVEITKEEFEIEMDKLYYILPCEKKDDLLVEMECLGNCEASWSTEVKYYYNKKKKEYTYRVNQLPVPDQLYLLNLLRRLIQ